MRASGVTWRQSGWRAARRGVPGLLALAFVLSGYALLEHRSDQQSSRALRADVVRLSADVHRLHQEQEMPALVLNRHRNSICYLYAEFSFAPGAKSRNRRVTHEYLSATGFAVADGLIVTSRHFVAPWREDAQARRRVSDGAHPKLEHLMAFFPGLKAPLELEPVVLSPDVDLALLRYRAAEGMEAPAALPLASAPSKAGEPLVVVGYPLGIAGLLAKSPPAVYQRLAYVDTMHTASELASLSLIRPYATQGHLGDVVGDKLIYDAPTAQGGSGGPIFNSRGEVIGVNTAYLDGFAGGTLGISGQALKSLIAAAQRQ